MSKLLIYHITLKFWSLKPWGLFCNWCLKPGYSNIWFKLTHNLLKIKN
jgi:hypothetical protein